jgi:hypothetical protein
MTFLNTRKSWVFEVEWAIHDLKGDTAIPEASAVNFIVFGGLAACQNVTCSHLSSTVHASVPANTFAIYGQGEDKELTELVPGILNQLGPDSLASLRKLAESYQSMQKEKGEDGKEGEDDDDDIPELVAGENFETKGEVE